MDLVLLKPGDPNLEGSSLIDGNVVGAAGEDLTGCIELVSMHFGMKQQITTDVSNTARTSGRPHLNDITLVKYFDKTSPLLYKHCLTAKPIGAGTQTSKIFVLRNSNDDSGNSIIGNILTIELTNAIVSALETQSHPNDMTTEQFTLNYTEIKWTYSKQSSDVITGGNVEFAWSVARNRSA